MQSTNLPAISELLKPGQEILVQIAKEPIGKKGARITGAQRDKLATDLKKKYEKGASIRALAEQTVQSGDADIVQTADVVAHDFRGDGGLFRHRKVRRAGGGDEDRSLAAHDVEAAFEAWDYGPELPPADFALATTSDPF